MFIYLFKNTRHIQYNNNNMINSNINNNKRIIKYSNIVNTILEDIQSKKIGIGAGLPSLNEICEQFKVSRETAIAAYRELKSLGVIKSNPRKGYFVTSDKGITKHNIFLFLDEMNGFKEVLYNGFKEGIGSLGTVDVYFHHFNAGVYEKIIKENLGNHTSYIIMPIPQKKCASLLKEIPESKLYILDIGLNPYGKKYPSVCQNFEKDIISTLTSSKDLLKKYNKLILVYPDLVQTQQGTINGFNYFCKEHQFKNERIFTAQNCKPNKGECYIVVFDNDLVYLVNSANEAKLELGKDIGILSCNDTPLKPIVANGITTMSSDFRLMGLTIADLVLNRKKEHIENPCYLIRRGSL
jgi:DNA-binding transcriptional regulator YhcF (GntR family)